MRRSGLELSRFSNNSPFLFFAIQLKNKSLQLLKFGKMVGKPVEATITGKWSITATH